MKLPPNITEVEFLETFDKVVSELIKKFKFGIHSEEDIKQEAMIFAIEGIERGYDAKRPLANFLYIHLKNRLYNFKRNNYTRIEKPCTRCPIAAFLPPEGCSAYEDRLDCNLYANWMKKNTFKKNLTHTIEYGSVNTKGSNMGYSNNLASQMNNKEILELIDRELPIKLRKSYLMMLSGNKVPKKEREIVEQEVLNIIKSNGYDL